MRNVLRLKTVATFYRGYPACLDCFAPLVVGENYHQSWLDIHYYRCTECRKPIDHARVRERANHKPPPVAAEARQIVNQYAQPDNAIDAMWREIEAKHPPLIVPDNEEARDQKLLLAIVMVIVGLAMLATMVLAHHAG